MQNLRYDKFTTEEVLQLINVPYDRSRSEVKIPCPKKCQPPRNEGGSEKGEFFLNMQSGKGQCFRCGYKGNITTYYAEMFGLTAKEAYIEILKRLGRWQEKGVYKKERVDRMYAPTPSVSILKKALPKDVIEHTLEELVSAMTLSSAHRAALIKRGIREESIESEAYRSYPCSSVARDAIVSRLKERGCTLLGVPGFYEKNGEIKLAHYSNGVFIPYRNAWGKIESAQIRLDKSDKCKYLMFSTSDEQMYPKGTRGTVSYHLCGKPDGSKTLMITEGALKARAIVDLMGGAAWVLAIPGVTMTRKIMAYIEEAKSLAPIEKVLIAYDMDEAINPSVRKASEGLISTLKAGGIKVGRLAWDNGQILVRYNLHPIEDELRRSPKDAIPDALQKTGLTKKSEVSFADEGIKGIIRVCPESPADAFTCGKNLHAIFECYERAYQVSFPLFQIEMTGTAKGLDDYLLEKRR